MNTYKVTTTTGYSVYIGSSQSPESFTQEKMGFDYDRYNARCLNSVKYGSGIINRVELFWCETERKQVRRVLTEA